MAEDNMEKEKEIKVRTNSLRAWLLASRPKTLTAAAVPVMVALALAWRDGGGETFRWLPAVLCLLFAWLMQIDSNFVNDYFDFVRGADGEDRLGPLRACAQGWITPRAMRVGMLLTTCIACLVGLPLVIYGGWTAVAVGVLCVAFCFLYTTWGSYRGLGDVLVLLFFGVVPLCMTYWLQTGTLPVHVVLHSLCCGLVTDTLLVLNNYRDREGDHNCGKRTLVVRLGRVASEWLYLLLGMVPCAVACGLFAVEGNYVSVLPVLVYLLPHVTTWRTMCRICQGRALNKVLGLTARNIFLYGLLLTAALLL